MCQLWHICFYYIVVINFPLHPSRPPIYCAAWLARFGRP